MKEVNAAIITIGDELLIGQTTDTNSAYISTELNKIGIWINKKVTIGDRKEQILETLTYESRNNKVIIITGGLGPTADDITKSSLCEYFQSKLIINDGALKNVITIFKRLNRPLIDRNLKQAEVPDNCEVLQNPYGTAPGMWFEKEGVIYVSLPGVPAEMKGLMTSSVIPKLKSSLQLAYILHRTLVVAGKGESEIAEYIAEFESSLPSMLRLAYLPSYGLVRLRLTGRYDESVKLEMEMSEQFHKLKDLLEPWMITDLDLSIEEALSRLLKEKNKTVSTAESCTGGFIAHLLTSRAGSSAIFSGSVIAYANELKSDILNVQKSTLEKFGAVSEQTVREMAQGALQFLKTDYVIATSGIMGPEGGSPEKPVGTVWIAIGDKNKIDAQRFYFRFNRSRNIEQTAQTALILLFRFISRAA